MPKNRPKVISPNIFVVKVITNCEGNGVLYINQRVRVSIPRQNNDGLIAFISSSIKHSERSDKLIS